MEDCNSENNIKKREREDSGLDTESPESKRSRIEIVAKSSESDRVDSDIIELDSLETKKITDDILDILEEPDTVSDRDPEIQDLESVIKSFEEEIVTPSPAMDARELFYLLEASDDELGLPPAFSPSVDKSEDKFPDLVSDPSEPVALAESLRFLDDLPNYDPFGIGFGEENAVNGDFITVGGLFDYSEGPEFSWRPESLPTL